jgi:hypothetical protein
MSPGRCSVCRCARETRCAARGAAGSTNARATARLRAGLALLREAARDVRHARGWDLSGGPARAAWPCRSRRWWWRTPSRRFRCERSPGRPGPPDQPRRRHVHARPRLTLPPPGTGTRATQGTAACFLCIALTGRRGSLSPAGHGGARGASTGAAHRARPAVQLAGDQQVEQPGGHRRAAPAHAAHGIHAGEPRRVTECDDDRLIAWRSMAGPKTRALGLLAPRRQAARALVLLCSLLWL